MPPPRRVSAIEPPAKTANRNPLIAPAAVAAAALVLAGCGSRFGAPRPASRQGHDVLELWRVLFVVALVLGTVVIALILWAVLRYRRRPGREPATFRANVPLEIFYTIVPLVIVIVLFVITLRVQDDVTAVTETPDVRVDVTGFQWGWRFEYVGQQVTVVGDSNRHPTLVLPVGKTTRVRLNSPDVIHSFFVPAFMIKRDTIPGLENRMDITPTRTGRFDGHCAEFCGLDHGRMNFIVEVLEPEEFDAWLASTRAMQASTTTTAVSPAEGPAAARSARVRVG